MRPLEVLFVGGTPGHIREASPRNTVMPYAVYSHTRFESQT